MENLPSREPSREPLNEKQVAFIIKYLALKKPYNKIKEDFQAFFERKISGEAIMDVEARHQPIVQEVAVRELSDIRRNPIAHPRIRLDILYDCLVMAMTPQIVRSVRITDTEYREIYGIDHGAVAKYLQLAREEEYLAKKLLLEKLKLDIEMDKDSGFVPVEIDTGMELVRELD